MTPGTWIDFLSVQDPRGQLVSAEVGRQIPFPVKRIYYLRNLKVNEPRGFHAHRDLQQVMLCVSGSCDVILDDGRRRGIFRCSDPTKGLYVSSMVWREMHNFSNDCIFLVLASNVYDESDYIRNYKQFVDATTK